MVVASVLCVKSASSGASDGVFCGQGAVAPSIVGTKSASDGRAAGSAVGRYSVELFGRSPSCETGGVPFGFAA